jgi:hypothetical protein
MKMVSPRLSFRVAGGVFSLVALTIAPAACGEISGLNEYSSTGVAGSEGGGSLPHDGAGDATASDAPVGSTDAEEQDSADDGGGADSGGGTEDGDGGEDSDADSHSVAADGGCQGEACASNLDSGVDAGLGAGQEASCTRVDLPPSVNVNAAQWDFAASPIWSCTTSATTTITANPSGASLTGDDCGGSATLADVSNDYAQTAGGPSVLVIRLNGLTLTGGHKIELAGTEPVIFMVNGDVTIDSAGAIDASASGATPGPGGDSSACGGSTGTNSAETATGGGGGSFGTAGGYGANSSGGNGSAAGAVAASLDLQPLRGGCAGGTGGGSTANPGGAGGGAFEISASGTITIGATSAAYLSAAGGYSPGASTSVTSNGSGGAGSGGGVLLASPVAATFGSGSVARAHGGGSGSGRGLSTNSNAGSNGSTTTNTPAAGGAAPDIGGAAGATGGLCAGTGTTCTTTATGSNGSNTAVPPPDGSGGGGGGGSVQVIAAPATVSCN